MRRRPEGGILPRALPLALLLAPLFACDGGEAPAVGAVNAVGAALSSSAPSRARVLVANSRGDNVVAYAASGGEFLGEFIAPGSGGLEEPDGMAIGPDGRLYVSSGASPETSAVLRFDAATGAFVDAFARGGGLFRPYGLAFGPDGRLYVASFLGDEVLRFDATTGAFVDVFARGDGLPGGLNGPNGLAFGPDGALYVSTEGSVAGEFPGLPSEVLRYDVATGRGSVFVAQPTPSPSSLGFVSLLGLAFGPDCEPGCDGARRGRCDLFVSDFANDVRRYDATTGELEQVLDTNYTGTVPSNNFVGGLSFGRGGRLFVTAFDREAAGNPGVLLRYRGLTGRPLPGPGEPGAVYVGPSPALVRPIGVLAVD